MICVVTYVGGQGKVQVLSRTKIEIKEVLLFQQSMFHHGIAGSQVLYSGGLPSQKNLITDQAGQILNENELGTLKYYLEEYSRGYISISAFALALFDLLSTPAKVWLTS